MNTTVSSFQPLDHSSLDSLPEVWPQVAREFGKTIALHDPHAKPEVILTYEQLYEKISQFAAGIQALGVKPGSKIALFADNSPRWFVADQGIMAAGAVNAVRSAKAERNELLYIFRDSDSTGLVVQDIQTLKKLKPEIDDLPVEFIVLLSDEKPPNDTPLKILNFPQLITLGQDSSFTPVKRSRQDLATLIYTSGTTGKPKGVMLSHGNLLHQIIAAPAVIKPEVGDRVLAILPSWHAYERIAEYYLLSQACTQIYTSLRTFKQDLKAFKPQFMVGVPRVWESIYEGVQKQFRSKSPLLQKIINFFFSISEKYVKAKSISENLSLDRPNPSDGDRLVAKLQMLLFSPFHALGDAIVYKQVREAVGGKVKTFISGGGSLARHLDTFYEITQVPLIVGYGLTETAPITNARLLKRNLKGASGPPLPETEIRIVDPETRQTLSKGQRGLVLIRGPQVMQGYYNKPEATAKAIDPEGWFDSGDLGMVVQDNNLVLTGRAKDTIVLSNGENIEPQPIEDACLCSPYIDQIMLVGQDQKMLGALIVPNLEALEKWVKSANLALQMPIAGNGDMANSPLRDRKNIDNQAILDLFQRELKQLIKNRPGYRPDDQVKVFRLILEPFSQENGMMTQTLKVRRPVVRERYRDIIDGMFG
ncbi:MULTISPECIES: AMP-binding protein [Spirulina sp. CCY15215]|uniref:AMP-dependent synthetase/ligase n=1 Tax=Spirulina sp. CCY15215 TaxID=2767591 RepID=UPI0019514556|nr:AMP-binding protein [Spirulina major]